MKVAGIVREYKFTPPYKYGRRHDCGFLKPQAPRLAEKNLYEIPPNRANLAGTRVYRHPDHDAQARQAGLVNLVWQRHFQHPALPFDRVIAQETIEGKRYLRMKRGNELLPAEHLAIEG